MTDNIRENHEENRPFTWWEKLKYIFTNPSKAFENISQHPNYLFPVLTIIIGMAILSYLRIDLYKEFYIEQMQRQFASQGVNFQGDIQSMAKMQGYISVFGVIIMLPITWLIKSGLVHGISKAAGGEGTFKQGFAAIVYAYFPMLLGSIIITIISLMVGKYDISATFAVILPETMKGNFLYNLLSQFDIFVIWYQILAVIGISYAYDISKKKASIGVLGTWIISILLATGIATVSYSLMGNM
ncbi:Yip1 family protein [Caldisalinibacter kiritimatiensis]|uniref:Yip1 domain-containing protein n=1 Tax=Caldisalinibacter kiritimatiensis TaxID=1304284 RepID=R1CML0_9FIRM|nr:Yip1 family protein [Caldisalinibacter kiritimatiensis]EOC99935.1 hypothetical protein L21TH_2024 [Caldisalinibacter kiritimatiensis]